MALKILDGSNPTLDASDLSYEFEKSKFTGNITRITTQKDPLNNMLVAYIETASKTDIIE